MNWWPCICDIYSPKTSLTRNYAGLFIFPAKSYHNAWREVDSANINNLHDIDRINVEVNRALHLYTETWNATKAVIITWVINWQPVVIGTTGNLQLQRCHWFTPNQSELRSQRAQIITKMAEEVDFSLQ